MTQQDEGRFKVPLFSGSDLDDWQFRLKVVLDEHGLLPCIEQEAGLLALQNALPSLYFGRSQRKWIADS